MLNGGQNKKPSGAEATHQAGALKREISNLMQAVQTSGRWKELREIYVQHKNKRVVDDDDILST